MNFCPEFTKLVNSNEWENQFIGYGNPNSEILIIGQEAGLAEGTDDWKKFLVQLF